MLFLNSLIFYYIKINLINKYKIMKLAIIALIGSSSAVQLSRSNKWQRYQMAAQAEQAKWDRFNMARDIYSNELANGDKSDDKEVEDENDARDSIVNDNGFVNQFKNHSSGGSMWATRAQMRNGELPSNEVANGDVSENKEIEDENDARDSIVNDNGFVNQWKNKTTEGSMWATRAQIENDRQM